MARSIEVRPKNYPLCRASEKFLKERSELKAAEKKREDVRKKMVEWERELLPLCGRNSARKRRNEVRKIEKERKSAWGEKGVGEIFFLTSACACTHVQVEGRNFFHLLTCAFLCLHKKEREWREGRMEEFCLVLLPLLARE